jgi:hypothetical protein
LPLPPVDTPVSTGGQLGMAISVVIGIAVLWGFAILLSRRHHTLIPVLIAVGAALSAFMEPIPDALANLWYYEPGQVTIYHAFDSALPLWVFGSYSSFYGGYGLAMWWLVERGLSRRRVIQIVGVLYVLAVVQEVAGTGVGTYEYYGPQPFRVFDFPIWMSLYNAAIVATIGIGAAKIRRSLPKRDQLLTTVFLVPATIVVGLIGTAFPMINLIHTEAPSTGGLYAAALASMALAGVMIYCATRLMPSDGFPPTSRLAHVAEPVPAEPSSATAER